MDIEEMVLNGLYVVTIMACLLNIYIHDEAFRPLN